MGKKQEMSLWFPEILKSLYFNQTKHIDYDDGDLQVEDKGLHMERNSIKAALLARQGASEEEILEGIRKDSSLHHIQRAADRLEFNEKGIILDLENDE